MSQAVPLEVSEKSRTWRIFQSEIPRFARNDTAAANFFNRLLG